MKVRTNCSSCRDRIRKECEDAFLKHQYKIFSEMSDSFATYAVTAILMTMVRRGRSKEYIQKLYDEMCFIFDTPAVMGKEVRMRDCMKLLHDDYGIDWGKIHVNCESESEFIKGTKNNGNV